MLIALPVSKADYKLALQLVEHVSRIGGIRPHKWLLVFTHNIPDKERKAIEARAAQGGDIAETVVLEPMDESGWPKSCNALFFETARVVEKAGAYGEPCWYFFEPDNTPVVPQWADLFQREYTQARKPYLGVIHDTWYSSPSTGKRFTKGRHMVGTGIYPPKLLSACRLMRHVKMTPWAFDVFLQWEVVPQTHHTELIQHNWQTAKYRRQGASIVCSPNTPRTGDLYSQPLREGIAVVHGCKDGSLIKVLSEPEQPTKSNKK